MGERPGADCIYFDSYTTDTLDRRCFIARRVRFSRIFVLDWLDKARTFTGLPKKHGLTPVKNARMLMEKREGERVSLPNIFGIIRRSYFLLEK